MYDNLLNSKFLEFRYFYELSNFENFLIFEIEQFQKISIGQIKKKFNL